MTLPSLDARRARELVAQFHGRPILVVGDVMLDRFIVGTVTRISPEAPVPVVRFQSEHSRLGGAANVAHNLAALGAQVSLVGVVGGDSAGERLRQQLAVAGHQQQGPGRRREPADGRESADRDRAQSAGRADRLRRGRRRDRRSRTAHHRRGRTGRPRCSGDRRVRLPERDDHPERDSGARVTEGTGRPAARRSEDSAPALLRRRDAGDAESSRGRGGDASPDPIRR